MIINKIKKNGYTFRDLAIVPRIPKKHYRDIEMEVQLLPNLVLTKPFISSPMDTVTNAESAIKLAKEGALGILHYNYQDKNHLLQEVQKVKEHSTDMGKLPVGVLVKCELGSLDLIKELYGLGVDLVAIDSLHTSPHMHIEVVKSIRDTFTELPIMSGNVVHPDDCIKLIESGVSLLRIGYSAASINDGKSMFGTGISQASAIYECSLATAGYSVPIVADGGIRNTGDIALAFALGADCVMLGRMFAASYDTPGIVFFDKENHKKKIYKGMSRNGIIDEDMLAEGKECILNAEASIIEILHDMDFHLRMSISRSGSISIKDFFENAEIQLLTQEAIRELEPQI